MGLVAENKKGYELVEEATHIGRCFKITDIGSVFNQKYGNWTHKVMLSFELPETKMKDGRPFAISKNYTMSMHEKSNLRKDLESWRGRKFTEKEAEAFNLKTLIGLPCLLSVIHSVNGDNTYANVAGVLSLPKGTVCPLAVNAPVIFDLDTFDSEVFATFSDKMRALIESSLEYKQRLVAQRMETETGAKISNKFDTQNDMGEQDGPPDEDVPF